MRMPCRLARQRKSCPDRDLLGFGLPVAVGRHPGSERDGRKMTAMSDYPPDWPGFAESENMLAAGRGRQSHRLAEISRLEATAT
jgi:hypothetical protein